MSLRNLLVLIGIWLGITCIFALFATSKLDPGKYRGLASKGVAVQGRVTGKEPENHQFLVYSYTVGQAVYSGKGNAGRGNPSFEQLKVGDPVKVYYDPDSPQISFLGDPIEQSASVSKAVIFMTILGPIILVMGLVLKGWLPWITPRSSANPSRDTDVNTHHGL